jgi:hypothetical protein
MRQSSTHRTLPSLIGAILVAVVSGIGVAHGAGPTLALSPISGQAGAALTVVGTGFVASDWVFLHWDVQGSPELGRTVTDRGGYFSLTVQVPAGAATGSHQVLAVAQGAIRASAFFTVAAPTTPTPLPTNPSLQVSPSHGQVSQQITLLGQGFLPNTGLTVWLDSNTSGHLLAQPTTDGAGHFSTGLTLPANIASGTHQILVYAQGREQAAALYSVDATPPPCTGFDISVPLVGDICLDVGGLVTDVINATFGAVANLFGGAWDAITSPFEAALINTPNFASDPTWTAFQQFVSVFQTMWATTFVAMFVFGMFARYLEAIGAGSFQGILGHLGRATMLTAFLALYNPIMANWVFPAENGLASAIANANINGTSGGLTLIGQAFQTVGSLVTLSGLLNLLILVLALVVGVLCVVVRDMGLGVLAGLYALGPLALVTWLSPQLDFIARWCVRTMISVLLWPVGYALALKVGSALINASGWANSSAGLLGSLGALGCLVLLYRVPAIIGSMAGSDSISGAISMVTDRGLQLAAAATRIAIRHR